MDYTEEKELACIICTDNSCSRNSKFAFVPNDHLTLCFDSLCIARRVLAAGYRKIDPEKLTIISQDEANVACLKRDRNRPYPKGTAGYIEVTQTMLEAQLAHTKRQIQEMKG